MCKFKIGDRVELMERYIKSPAGSVGIVTKIRPGSEDFLVSVDGVCCAFAFRFKLVKPSYPNPPHKHAELIKAWADGAEIEYNCRNKEQPKWIASKSPMWSVTAEYRIKPQKTAKDIKLEELEAKARKLADEIKELRYGS